MKKQDKICQFKLKKCLRRLKRKRAGITKKRQLQKESHLVHWHAPVDIALKIAQNEKHIVIDAINNLHKLFRSGNKIIFDFSKTEHIFPDGGIYLLAQICALRTKYPNVEVKCLASMTNRTKEVLFQIGLLDRLGWSGACQPTREDVIHWRVATGVNADGAKYEDVLKDYDGALAPPLQEKMYNSIVEAMTNISHAYDEELTMGHPFRNKKWWMFSQERDNNLSVVFCDVGVGIPKSLPRQKNLAEHIFEKLRLSKSDSKAIELAIQHSQSRTKQGNRGKGLHQITTLLSSINGSKISIRSNSGLYVQENEQNASEKLKISTRDIKSAIIGTIIAWTIPLPNTKSGDLS